MSEIKPLTFAILGGGGRGNLFSHWLSENPFAGQVVAVAEPDPVRRARIADRNGVPLEGQFSSWEELLARPRLADILINTTMDREHVASAIKGMRAGYHMLLEKPMATSLKDCEEIDRVREETGRIVSVCHSLRYHIVYEELKKLLTSGAIGDLVSLDQMEAVQIIHQSHSFVRGNWGNEGRSTFMLLAKSCHDIDIIAYLADRECTRVSSFGELTYFNKKHAPEGAPEYCVDGCPVERSCPYHSLKVYGEGSMWRDHAGLENKNHDELLLALRSVPHGRCVFQTDNDVVDHQIVAMEFEGGMTATFTMTAFTPFGGRYVRLHGTKGYIYADVDKSAIDLYQFWEGDKHTRIDLGSQTGSHGGADDTVIRSLIDAVRQNDPSLVRTTTAESLRTHRITFAAEQSRREKRTVELERVRV